MLKSKLKNEMIIVLQESVDDVAPSVDEELQHDAEVAASGDIELRVSHVPEHDCR